MKSLLNDKYDSFFKDHVCALYYIIKQKATICNLKALLLFSFILLRPQNKAGSLLCATTTCLFNSAVKFNLGTN